MSGLKLAYTLHNAVRGKGPALIILHGLFGSARNWKTIAENLNKTNGMPVYTVDLRNHGQTYAANGSQPMTWRDLSSDLGTTLRDIGHDRYDLMGHSFGGQVIMQASFLGCCQIDRLVRKLVIVDVAPKPLQFKGSQISKLLDRMISLEAESLKKRSDAVNFMSEIEPHRAVVEFLLSNGHVHPQTGLFQFKLPLKVLRDEVTSLQDSYNEIRKTQNILKETLFIKGERSEFIKLPDDQKLVATHFDSYEIKQIEGAGHWPHYDQPEIFTRAVSDFLRV